MDISKVRSISDRTPYALGSKLRNVAMNERSAGRAMPVDEL